MSDARSFFLLGQLVVLLRNSFDVARQKARTGVRIEKINLREQMQRSSSCKQFSVTLLGNSIVALSFLPTRGVLRYFREAAVHICNHSPSKHGVILHLPPKITPRGDFWMLHRQIHDAVQGYANPCAAYFMYGSESTSPFLTCMARNSKRSFSTIWQTI